jgi:hypothetical protein
MLSKSVQILWWLLVHQKIRNADNLTLREWPHWPICKLRHIHQEAVQHLSVLPGKSWRANRLKEDENKLLVS